MREHLWLLILCAWMNMRFRILSGLLAVSLLYLSAGQLSSSASPSEPEARLQLHLYQSDGASLLLETHSLSSRAISRPLPTKAELIDAAITKLYGGELTQRHDDRALSGMRREVSLTKLRRPTDWRSRDAWGDFLIEARQQASVRQAGPRVKIIAPQFASLPVQPNSGEDAETSHGLVEAGRKSELVSEKPAPDVGEVRVRVSASAVEVRAIEMITPVSAVPNASKAQVVGPASEAPRQLVGSVFIDRDGDGEPGRGDTRLEGQMVSLTPLRPGQPAVQHRSATFGQFAFEGVVPGAYLLSVSIGWEEVVVPIEIDHKRLGARVSIAVPPELTSPVPISLASAGGMNIGG